MSRKVKVLIGVLLGVMMLTLGGTAIAFADDTAAAPVDNATSPSILDRIAEILKIDKQTLTDAFNQARQEMQADNQTRFRERRELTEEEKAQLQERRQEQIEKMKERMLQMRERAAEARQQMLDRAVEKGTITGDEKQGIIDWWNARPEALDKLGPQGGIGNSFCPPGQFKKAPNATQNQRANRVMPGAGMMGGVVR
ncbi:MAG: hypothetical protein PHR43_00080 [Dehalococcoidales bacterium]|nr:hypothetical protein [Dehalococcoidales bacterium]